MDEQETRMSRRAFFSRHGMGQALKTLAPMLGAGESESGKTEQAEPVVVDSERQDERTVMAGYFSSHLYSYALLSEMPWDMLIEEAKRHNIAYDGRSKLDIVRELFIGTGGKEESLS